MEWIETLNEAINYIEENLTEEINFEDIAKIAYCSSYQFQRMFSYIAGVTLADYIRRRRMSLAATELQAGDKKIIDIALKYGYASPTAFNRAFQTIHGFAPSKIKKNNVSIKSYPALNFQIIAKGVEAMEFRVEKKEMIRVLGVAVDLPQDLEEAYEKAEQLWLKVLFKTNRKGDVTGQGKICTALNKAINVPYADGTIAKHNGFFGIEVEKSDGGQFVIAVESPAEPFGELQEYFIPANTWAIFQGGNYFAEDYYDAQSANQVEERLYKEWLPTSGYDIADTVMVTLLHPTEDLENAPFETWLPVKKK